MANTKSAQKRNRQALKRRARNQAVRTQVKSAVKRAREALASLARQALHAYLLAFEHPTTGQILEFRSELPEELLRLHHSLRAGAPITTGKAQR